MNSSHHLSGRLAVAAGITVVSLLAAGCGSGSGTAPAATATLHGVASGLRGERYCEVLLVHAGLKGISVDVYSSSGLNDCPQSEWATLDAGRIADDDGALTAMLNGPCYWLMDSIAKDGATAETKTFGGIAMRKEATVSVGNPATASRPYTPHTVNRRADFTFNAGRQIYELVEPDGTRWVMQSWSQKTDPNLAQADLAGLASRLTPPSGWSYQVRTLTSPLHVLTATPSVQVLQDDLNNSYSQQPSG